MPRKDRPRPDPLLAVEAGLCGSCRFADLRTTARSAFIRCRRSEADPRFPRYPALPVRDCPGFEEL